MTDGLTERDRQGILAVIEAFPKIKRAILFGSRAIGTFRGASDLDLALEGDELKLADLVKVRSQIGRLELPFEADVVIRAKITNPDVEKHIKEYGRVFYARRTASSHESEWREMSLGDFVHLQRGHDLTENQRKPGHVPVMGSAGMNGYHATAKTKGPGVVVGRSGASFGQVHFCPVDYWPHNTALFVTDFRGNDPRFAYYFLKSIDFSRYNSGSAQASLNRNFIKPIRVRVPQPPEQRAIASVLEALDDKIELNRRMNETLEALAQRLFKSWFVDATQSTLPKGWHEVPFAETVEMIGGGTPKTSVAEYWSGDIPWFSVVDSPQGSDLFVIDTEKKITKAGVENSSTQILPVGTTIITARGTVGKIALVGVPMAMNQSCYGLQGKVGKKGFHTYFVTRALVSQFQQHAHGSVFDTITRDTLAGVQVALPPAPVVEQFEEKVSPLMERIRNNLHESRTLAALRDALLPKLLSGELRVPQNLEVA